MSDCETPAGEMDVKLDLPRLTRAEDIELRQLAWFSTIGPLSEASQARLDELVARDRRGVIRDPRPDPVSRAADEVGTKLQIEDVIPTRCQNCGTFLKGRALCHYCGHRSAVA